MRKKGSCTEKNRDRIISMATSSPVRTSFLVLVFIGYGYLLLCLPPASTGREDGGADAETVSQADALFVRRQPPIQPTLRLPPLGGRGGNAPFPTRHKAGTPLWAAPCFLGVPRPDHTGTQGFPIRPGLPRFPEAQAGNSSFPCGRAPRLPARARDSFLTVYQTLPPIATGDRRKWRIFSRFSPFSQGRAAFLPPSRPGGAFRRENLAAPGGIVLE